LMSLHMANQNFFQASQISTLAGSPCWILQFLYHGDG
jgi:hypothetical protein